MNKEVEERCSKLIDPEFHYQTLADQFRKKLAEANEAYQECLKYGMAAHFYIGPNFVLTNLPDRSQFKRVIVNKY